MFFRQFFHIILHTANDCDSFTKLCWRCWCPANEWKSDCRLQTGIKMQTRYKMQTADCRLSTKCRLTRKTFFYVRNVSTFDFITYLLVVSIGKWSAARFMWEMLCHLRSIVEGWVNMSCQIRVFCQRLISLKTFLFLENVLRSTQ